MAGNDWLSDLKLRIDIIDVVSRYATLEQKGKNFWLCCPFHHEKTPSMAVNRDRQSYHCFGCGESGDAIKFVQKIESCDFIVAVNKIADWVGFQIPQLSNSKEIEEKAKKKKVILEILKETAFFYYSNLMSGKATLATEYMKMRGIDDKTAKSFGLGCSLGFNELPAFLMSKGFKNEEILLSGVCDDKDGRLIDAQAKRLVFPIINSFSQVVAFGGRSLEKDVKFAKYKNTSQTMVFDKSQTLFNINLVKKLKQTETVKSLIVVEGYMDALALYKAGFKNVVASMGTSLTVNQAKELKRLVDVVIISYDGDGAGQKATLRGLDILANEGLTVKVVELSDGQDPDDVINKMGREHYQLLLNKAVLLTDFKLKIIKNSYDLSDDEQKLKFVQQALNVVKDLKTSVEQSYYLKTIQKLSKITYEALEKDLNVMLHKNIPPTSVDIAVSKTPKIKIESGEEKALRFILYSLVANKLNIQELQFDLSRFIDNNVHRLIYESYSSMQGKNNINDIMQNLTMQDNEEFEKIMQCKNLMNDELEQEFLKDCLFVIERKALMSENEFINAEYENSTSKDRRMELAKLLQKNIKRLQILKHKGAVK